MDFEFFRLYEASLDVIMKLDTWDCGNKSCIRRVVWQNLKIDLPCFVGIVSAYS